MGGEGGEGQGDDVTRLRRDAQGLPPRRLPLRPRPHADAPVGEDEVCRPTLSGGSVWCLEEVVLFQRGGEGRWTD